MRRQELTLQLARASEHEAQGLRHTLYEAPDHTEIAGWTEGDGVQETTATVSTTLALLGAANRSRNPIRVSGKVDLPLAAAEPLEERQSQQAHYEHHHQQVAQPRE